MNKNKTYKIINFFEMEIEQLITQIYFEGEVEENEEVKKYLYDFEIEFRKNIEKLRNRINKI